MGLEGQGILSYSGVAWDDRVSRCSEDLAHHRVCKQVDKACHPSSTSGDFVFVYGSGHEITGVFWLSESVGHVCWLLISVSGQTLVNETQIVASLGALSGRRPAMLDSHVYGVELADSAPSTIRL